MTSRTNAAGRPIQSILISLGSNVEPGENLERAVEKLANKVEIVSVSRVFRSAAFGAPDAGDFLNAAVEVRSTLPPAELKYSVLRRVEAELGRVRSADRNAPRTIDLDIALYGDEVIENEALALAIPDPQIRTAAHVAIPLADLAPERRCPPAGSSLSELARPLAVAETVREDRESDRLRRLVGRQS